jgi:hypothetical protein
MKLSGTWKDGKEGKKKTGSAYRAGIQWESLDLSNPDLVEPATSIETIRKDVSSLASRRCGQGARWPRPKRRGATEYVRYL